MDVHVAMATSGNAFFQAFQCHMINNPFQVQSMLNYVPRLPSCPTCLTCLTCLRACLFLFLTCLPFYSYLTCLPFLRASCVSFFYLLSLSSLRGIFFYVPSFFMCLTCPYLFTHLTCLNLLTYLTCLHFSSKMWSNPKHKLFFVLCFKRLF